MNIWIPPLSLHVARGAILSADGLLGLIPFAAGRTARVGSDFLQKTVAAIQDEGFDVNVNVRSKKETVKVRIHMV
ncbi:MAG: hypothetical protein LBR72_02920 [Oscillospiraceae bacterium]|nr:hypothetical protein [Oscillospiraceae bacterium]